ncbi:hypothetical protein HKD37_02G003846 [Glycine soja]
MEKCRKLNTIQNNGQSQAKEQSIKSNHWGNPMGWEGKTLVNAIGSLVRRHQSNHINFLSWKDMPEDYISNMEILINDMSLKWRQFKYELKSKGYDESKIKEEMVAHIPDPRVDPSQYRDLVHYWCSEKGQKIRNINKRNRLKYEDLHCMGIKNLSRRIHEMTTKAKGVQPSRAEIYIDTQTRKDGNLFTENAATTNDIYSKVKGRVRCLGKLPHQASSPQSSYADNRIQKLENLIGNLVIVLKVPFA